MGNMHCPAEDAALLASVARDICPFPNYNLNPVYLDMLTLNSSHHLSRHYAAVQSSLSPKQSDDFTYWLRSIFGREGKVTLGGVGVVALSLAVLFDTLATKVKGERVPDSGPIPNLFLKDVIALYPPSVNIASEYLRLIPYFANNPERMKEETKRYFQEMRNVKQKTERDRRLSSGDVSGVNHMVSELFQRHMEFHLHRIANSTEVEEAMSLKQDGQEKTANTENTNTTTASASHVAKTRKRRIPPPEKYVIFSFNCNPEEASRVFLEEVDKLNDTKAAWNECKPRHGKPTKTWLHHIASLAWLDVINGPVMDTDGIKVLLMNQREDFDLKAGALGKW